MDILQNLNLSKIRINFTSMKQIFEEEEKKNNYVRIDNLNLIVKQPEGIIYIEN